MVKVRLYGVHYPQLLRGPKAVRPRNADARPTQAPSYPHGVPSCVACSSTCPELLSRVEVLHIFGVGPTSQHGDELLHVELAILVHVEIVDDGLRVC